MSFLNHRLAQCTIEKPLFSTHMSFIIGPRQSGKTTLALNFLKNQSLSLKDYYFNWDRPEMRKKFKLGGDWLSSLRDPLSSKKNLFLFLMKFIKQGSGKEF